MLIPYCKACGGEHLTCELISNDGGAFNAPHEKQPQAQPAVDSDDEEPNGSGLIPGMP